MPATSPPFSTKILTVPNLITVVRFVLVPVIIYLILKEHWQSAFWVFIIAGISDAIDGLIARQFNQQSKLGAYIDPIADKLLLVSVFVLLAVSGNMPLWLVIVIVARDIFIVGGVVLAAIMSAEVIIRPIVISKANTVVQIVLAGYIFAAKAWQFQNGIITDLLIYLTAALTLASGCGLCRDVVWPYGRI
ncbi:Cardiolipin synthase (CMP-forming) [Nymphon striatum]|nr:Cardiolipin synthase (CMP-forming) [Nymphon striatum]